MKLLFDECITIHYEYGTKYFLKRQRYETSIDILGDGTKDDQILEYARQKRRIIVTCDKRFIQKLLDKRMPVVCVFSNGSMVKMEKIGHIKDPNREITRYAIKNDTIVIP